MKYKNKVCLIVGATSVVGKALVHELLKREATVIAAGRNSKKLDSLLREISSSKYSGRIIVYTVDITKTRSIDDLVGFIEERFKEINYCFNLAGVCFYKDYLKVSESEIQEIININLVGVINLSRKVIAYYVDKKTAETSYFVQIGSMAGAIPGHKRFSLYAATKEAQAGLIRSLQAEFQDENIHLILVTPTGIDTNIYESSLGDKISLKEKFVNSILDKPEDVARGILDKLENNTLVDHGLRLLPTALAETVYAKFSK